ncbi:MAG: hypothetical protein QF915_04710 [Candidatus Woesearchaeota archaeon]|jgi:hypothetical protein|nr:hypothetical protein [Candidatus Woesearchaeota archaeon]MDP7458318.1 hypothetical protein [Candidatus Woesearchaeota archaeon]
MTPEKDELYIVTADIAPKNITKITHELVEADIYLVVEDANHLDKTQYRKRNVRYHRVWPDNQRVVRLTFEVHGLDRFEEVSDIIRNNSQSDPFLPNTTITCSPLDRVIYLCQEDAPD